MPIASRSWSCLPGSRTGVPLGIIRAESYGPAMNELDVDQAAAKLSDLAGEARACGETPSSGVDTVTRAESLAKITRSIAGYDADLRARAGLPGTPRLAASTLGRLLARLDGDAFDSATCGYLTSLAACSPASHRAPLAGALTTLVTSGELVASSHRATRDGRPDPARTHAQKKRYRTSAQLGDDRFPARRPVGRTSRVGELVSPSAKGGSEGW
jgi:hypothetical protein